MKTIINVECMDQELVITNSPVIASGGVHENFIAFNFCEKWDGLGKTAVFYRNEKERFYSVLDPDDVCEVPHEVTDYEGTMYFGVYGESDEVTKTSKILKYKINQGAMTTLLNPSEEPTPDIYQQLLSAYGQTNEALATEKAEREASINALNSAIIDEENARKQADATEKAERQAEIAVERARINQLSRMEEGSTTGDAELIDIRVGANGKTYTNAGDAVRTQVSELNERFRTDEITENILVAGQSITLKPNDIIGEVTIEIDPSSIVTVFKNESFAVDSFGTQYQSATETITITENTTITCDSGSCTVKYFLCVNIGDLVNDTVELFEKTDTRAKSFGYLKNLNTRSLWEQGNMTNEGIFGESTSDYYNKRIRTKNFIDADSIEHLHIENPYQVNVYCYDDNAFIAMTGNYKDISKDIFPSGTKKVILQIRRGDNPNSYIDMSAWESILIMNTKSDCKHDYKNEIDLWQQGYFSQNDGHILTDVNSRWYKATIITTNYIHENIRVVKCEYPYVARYYQFKKDGSFMGFSDKSSVLVIPDNNYKYKIQVVNGNNTDKNVIDVPVSEYSKIKFVCDKFTTKYGRTAYFPAFRGIETYYSPYQESFDAFNRETTTSEYYSLIDTLISNSKGYIKKSVLGKDSSGTHDIIRLDCVENGVDGQGTFRINKPKIIIVAGQHGGEKCSCYSLYYLLKDLVENWTKSGTLEYIRNYCHMVILPIANPYGFDNVSYLNANGVNLNRNYEYNFDEVGSGSHPLSEAETQIIANIVKSERSAIYLADYHCNGDGQTLDEYARPNWHSQLQTYDSVHDSICMASKAHIDNISCHWWEEYTFLDKETYGSCGSIDTGVWETGWSTLQGYASRNGIIANTFEGFNGFYGREAFGAEATKGCTELICNWIITVLQHYEPYFNVDQFLK